jgi:nucleoside-triphosphatase THEP1
VRPFAGLLLAATAVVVLFGDPLYAAWAALVAIAAAWILYPPAVYTGLRVGVVLAIAFAAAITAAVVAWSQGPQRGLETGGMVLLRLLVLTVVAAILVRKIDAEGLLRQAQRLGFERFGLVLGLALNSLPRITGAASEVWSAYRLRSRSARDRLRRLPGLGEVLLAHTARIAEEASAAASLRGHAALTRPGALLRAPLRTVVVTGPQDSGKTAAVIAVAERLRAEEVPVAGIVQLGQVDDEGFKIGFRLRDIATGDEAQLASRDTSGRGEFGTRFRFSEEGFRLGRTAVSRARAGGVLVIDELGPVELRGAGHMPAVRRAIATPDLVGAVVVVRRPLVPSLLAALEASDAVVIDVEDEGEAAVTQILSELAVLG